CAAAAERGAFRDEPRWGCHISRAGTDGGVSDFAARRDSQGCGLVCADAGRADDPDYGGVWDFRGTRSRQDRNLGYERRREFCRKGAENTEFTERRNGGREIGSDWGAYQP